ncbi:alpha/beta hydrolase [Pseudochryseolinea flava]|nr:alpha/beta hydrolase [Pseudochryseolinea flava]
MAHINFQEQPALPKRLVKRAMSVVFALICITFLQTSCDEDDKDARTNTAEELTLNDLSYGPDTYNTMDLYLPAGRTKETRIVLFIHGGGWREGSKEQFSAIVDDFVDEGFVAAAINYRPANVEANINYIQLLDDIDTALKFLSENASQYVYNSNSVHLFGHSAGAHLGLLYAYRNNPRGQVKSVISLSAPTDLEGLLENDVFPTLLYNLVGSDDLEKFKDASPINHVSPSSVPTFFIHGKSDQSVPYQQSEILFQQLTQWNKLANELELIENEGHDFSEEAQTIIVSESIAYLKRRN